MRGVLGRVDARRARRGRPLRPASRRGARRGCRRGRRRRCRRRGCGSAAASAGDQPRQLELAPQRRNRRRQVERAERVGGELGHDADPRQEPRRALRRSAPSSARRARRVFTQISTRATASGGWPASRASRPATSAREKSTPGGSAKTRGPSARREQPGHRASSASASAMPSGRPTSTQPPGWTRPREPALGDQRVPDRVEREDLGGEGVERRGVDDLRAGVDEVGGRRGAAAAQPAGGVEQEIARPAVAERRGPRHERRAAPPMPGVQAAASAASGFGPRQTMSALSVKTGPGPSSGSARLEPAAGLEQQRLVRDQRLGRDAGEVRAQLLGVGVGVDHDPRDAGGADQRQRVVDQRAAGDLDQRLRPVAGQRAHAGAEPGGEDHHRLRGHAPGLDAGAHVGLRRRQVAGDPGARAARGRDGRGRAAGAPRPAAGSRGSAACRRGGRAG